MSVVITLEDIRAYAEVDYIINHVNIKYQNMVPEKLRKFFNEYKDPNIEIKVNPYIPLQSQGLSRYALELIALIHLKYWCEDEARREELYAAMLRNQERIDANMKNRFDIDSLFNAEESNESEETVDFSTPKEVLTVEDDVQEEIIEESNVEEAEEVSEDNHPVGNKKNGIMEVIKKFFLSIFGNKK